MALRLDGDRDSGIDGPSIDPDYYFVSFRRNLRRRPRALSRFFLADATPPGARWRPDNASRAATPTPGSSLSAASTGSRRGCAIDYTINPRANAPLAVTALHPKHQQAGRRLSVFRHTLMVWEDRVKRSWVLLAFTLRSGVFDSTSSRRSRPSPRSQANAGDPNAIWATVFYAAEMTLLSILNHYAHQSPKRHFSDAPHGVQSRYR